MLLADRTAIVHGGSGAVGAAVARAFAREGAVVHLTGRTVPPLEDVARRIREDGGAAHVAELDATDRDAVARHADMVAAADATDPGFETTNRVYTARALAGRSVLRAADLAFEVAGGAGFFRDAGFERLFRDVQGARFHPLQDGDQRRLAAALALGLDPDAM